MKILIAQIDEGDGRHIFGQQFTIKGEDLAELPDLKAFVETDSGSDLVRGLQEVLSYRKREKI